MINEAVGQHHRPDLQPLVELPRGREVMQHLSGKAANRRFLDGDQDLVLPSELVNQRGVDRLCEPRVRDRGREAMTRQLVGGLEALLQPRAQAQDRYLGAFAYNTPAPDLQGLAVLR